jgi:hypothetical protein
MVFEPFYDPSDLSACVPAGTSVAELNEKAGNDGIYFPLWRDASEGLGSLYLNTRICSRSFRFGMMGDNTLGLRFSLKNAKSIDLGGRVVKNVVGFDLTRFFSGSKGRLGQPINLVLRLRPLPEIRREIKISGSLDELDAFRASLMKSAWVHCIDAFDFELSLQGLRLGLAFSCTRPEEAVFEGALRSLAGPCTLEDAPLPRHSPKPGSSLLSPLSQTLYFAKKLQGRHGGRISGYLGHGLMLVDAEKPLPALPLDRHQALEADALAMLEALP